MSSFIRRSVSVLPVLAGACAAILAAVPAQAAGSWSSPITLPAAAGFSENPSGAQLVVTGTGPAVSSSANGLTWSAPVAVSQGGTGAVTSLAPGGQAVAAWIGGTASAPVIQASVQPPGGSWSAPVTVGSNAASAPLIGTDAAGDAVIAWKGAATGTGPTGPVYAARLPAGGSWTAPVTLTTTGGPIQMAVNPAGAVVITWGAVAHAAWADSGTIRGGFTAPVMVGPSSYGHTDSQPQVALNSAGQAVVAWSGAANGLAATRTASGTWSGPQDVNCTDAFSAAIDGAGDAVVTCEEAVLNAQGQYVTSYYASRLPAGSATWTPALLTGDFLSEGLRSAADTAGTFVIADFDATVHSLVTFTSPPGAGFGPAVLVGDATSAAASLNLTVPGHATLVWTSSAGAFESTEPVS